MSLDALKDTFFAECDDLLDSLSEGLAAVADGDHDLETINAIFRSVHSIKGAAGAFALDDLVDFTHKYETVLDLIRSEALSMDEHVLHVITRSADCLADLVDNARDDDDTVPEAVEKLTQALIALADANSTSQDEGEDEDVYEFVPLPLGPIEINSAPTNRHFAITFEPTAALYRNGHEPAHLFAALNDLGSAKVRCDTSTLPSLADLAPDESYLTWEITLEGDTTEGQIREVFSFVEGLCALRIEEQVLDEPDLVHANEAAETTPVAPVPSPAPADCSGSSDVSVLQKTVSPQKDSQKPKTTASPTLRVEPQRVDRLINTAGELIINQAVITQKLEASGVHLSSELHADLDKYRDLARDIQEGVMAIRAQPVKPLFQRMGRIAREAADAIGKSIQLLTEGEATEIDKTLVERLAEPLTHIVRNAIDHGIEASEARQASGKPTIGQVRLSAEHRSGHVQITIEDDGAGINRARVFDIAVAKKLIPPDSKLSDQEIDNLLFLPGFSTAKEVTNLSGRGVGMDVVKTSIQSVGGRVSISSEPGKGSTISISLPLTLAVMDGMIVKAGSESLILPLSSIIETIRPREADILPFGQFGQVLSVRGAYVPIVNLAAALNLAASDTARSEPCSVFALIEVGGTGSIALGVDGIVDQRQIVIKSLEGNYGAIPGISAATILGDGQIALIIDVDAVVQMAGQSNALTDVTPHKKEIALGQSASME